ncbi:DoxX family protein [Roseivivax sp. GX 12232]|uniref:DoxX family protein n=1 Tax=Roseivivax sp. GX 12232 TaxID=2900547 RepID=UPI001E3F0E3C|nr:DoxX family protein [Roseivivax sp. GX 12232]MCE0504828.1 DoxX family protein [Roseivivax sp. GX 12232]
MILSDLAALVGRLLIAALFAAGTVQKLADPGPAMALLTDRGWPELLIWPATLFNGAAALALILGLWTRPVAAALAAYCMVTSYFHFLPEDPWQMSIFVKNWAVAGGCLVLSAHGPGRFALAPLR